MNKNVFVYTFGCQMNVHDSEKMLGILSEKGYSATQKPEDADLIIFNTCAIREKAEQKFYSQLGRAKLLKRRKPDLKIAVAGCVAQEAKDSLFHRAPYVDFLIGPQNLNRITEVLDTNHPKTVLEVNEYLPFQEFSARRDSNIKAWVSIMYGCNNFCSYCIVPYTRGREVSRPSSSILSEIRDLKGRGFKEITLLGQNVNSYRSDMDFPELLRQADSIGLERVRFVTSHPRDMGDGLIDAMASLESVCEHIHLPIQSGSDRVLGLMNRGYTYAQYKEKIRRLRDRMPDIATTADVIAGFPGETEDDHALTVRALEETEFDGIFAFMFSARKGTRAFEMPDHLPEEVKNRRLKEILGLQEKITLMKNRLLEGSVVEILIEGPSETDPNMLMGRTRGNKIVTVRDNGERPGTLLMARIETARQHSLSAVILDS